jgi:hypothetical protein
MSNLDTTMLILSHPYSNTNHANVNKNSQPEIHHLPFNNMQSYDIENNTKHISLVDELNIYPPLIIKINK